LKETCEWLITLAHEELDFSHQFFLALSFEYNDFNGGSLCLNVCTIVCIFKYKLKFVEVAASF
jgi:hypothetical protein